MFRILLHGNFFTGWITWCFVIRFGSSFLDAHILFLLGKYMEVWNNSKTTFFPWT